MAESQTVLVVDERPQNLCALEQLLEELRVTVVPARTGAEALALSLRHDLALGILDVQMPDMHGFKLATLLRKLERSRRLPVIFVTATHGAEDQVFQGYASGAVDYVVKPFHASVLLAKTRVFLELDQQRRELAEQQRRVERLAAERTRELCAALGEQRERADLLQSVLGALPGGVLLQSADGAIQVYNAAAERLLGLTVDETTGRAAFDPRLQAIHEDGSPFPTAWHPPRVVLQTGIPQRGVVLGLCGPDGTRRWLSVSSQPLVREEEAGPGGVVTSCHDITDRVQAEAARRTDEVLLQHSQRLEAVGRLAGGVAHDSGNLLSVILPTCGFLLRDLPRDNPLRADVEEIKDAAERAASLTRQLLAFGRKQVLEPRALDLNLITAELRPTLRRLLPESIALRVEPAPALELALADPGQLEQVIVSLAVNARDAMPDGGTLTVTTANVELDEAFARTHAGAGAGPHVLLTVADTGGGMDAATRARVFEPFFTTKERGQGVGLGLATVHGIVAQSGGHIEVASEPGRGTTFRVYLPRAEAAWPAWRGAAPPTWLRGSETVLVVEDEARVLALAARVLRGLGYRVYEANGLAAARGIAAAVPVIDVVVTDVVMPDGGGQAVAVAVRAAHPAVKLVFMSGYTPDTVGLQGVLEARLEFLPKPFTAPSLGRKVRQVLDGEGAACADDDPRDAAAGAAPTRLAGAIAPGAGRQGT